MQISIDGARLRGRLEYLATFTETDRGLTRMVFTPQHRRCNAQVATWMGEAGMTTHVDAIGNICGRYEGKVPGAKAILLASHLDTVRDAGRFDGMAGVVAAIACVDALNQAGERLEYPIEVVGFADEEGTRFGATMLGSRAIAGSFDRAVLDLRDEHGLPMREAMRLFGLDPDRLEEARRRPEEFAAYLELHIEQGPVLEALGLPVGVVTAIAGATRLTVDVEGMAGHAGTVPMAGRSDALVVTAEAVLAVERICRAAGDVVGTVGRVEVLPGAVNVIPGRARFTIDMRSPRDSAREAAVSAVLAAIQEAAAAHGAVATARVTHTAAAVPCDPGLRALFASAIAEAGIPVHELSSGAGHDAMVMADIAPIGMVFVRCKGGISHNPAEDATGEDLGRGAEVLLRALRMFRG
jgi:allantoate deiminase